MHLHAVEQRNDPGRLGCANASWAIWGGRSRQSIILQFKALTRASREKQFQLQGPALKRERSGMVDVTSFNSPIPEKRLAE